MSKPNFVVIMTDQQSYDMVGTYAPESAAQTPNIDALGQDGVVFDRAYTASPVCTPARASIFTGMLPHSTGCLTNGQALAQNVKQMGELFAERGYRTGYFGKWHLDGAGYFGAGVPAPGWSDDAWYDGARYVEEIGMDAFAVRRQLTSVEALREHSIVRSDTWAGRNTDRAIDFLKRSPNGEEAGPVLLVVSYDEPHPPYICPPEFAEPFEEYDFPVGPAAFDSLEGKPKSHQNWARELRDTPQDFRFPMSEWSEHLASVRSAGTFRRPMQFGCNAFVDSEIGKLLDAVYNELGDDTVIFFTSDHGDMNGAHGLMGKGPAMYDQITRVPFIVHSPSGVFTRGRRTQEVSTMDIVPTMLSLIDGDLDGLDGSDLSPLLQNPAAVHDVGALIQFHRFEMYQEGVGGWQPIRSLVKDGWKLVVNLNYSDELYNLNEDPHELRNLVNSSDCAAQLDVMHKELHERMQASLDLLRGAIWSERYADSQSIPVPEDWRWRVVPTPGGANRGGLTSV